MSKKFIVNLCLTDLRQSLKASRLCWGLGNSIPESVDYLQYEILEDILEHLLTKPIADGNIYKNLSIIFLNLHEIMAFSPRILILAVQVYRPLYLDFRDLVHKFELELVKTLGSVNNQPKETFEVVDFEKLSKIGLFKVEQLPAMILKYILLSDNKDLQLVALKTLRKIGEQKEIRNKYIKPGFKKVPKLFTLFVDNNRLEGVNENTIIHEIPKEEVEILQIFESIDSLYISDSALIELINTQEDLFSDLLDIKHSKESFGQIITKKPSSLDNITKVTNQIEMKIQEGHLKSFEKRSKARSKNLEIHHTQQKNSQLLLEDSKEKYEILFQKSMQEFGDLLG